MSQQTLSRATHLMGAPLLPGDKSISHRVLILGAMADGTTEATNILESEDIQSTMSSLCALGVEISRRGDSTKIKGQGVRSFSSSFLNCGNSGTTIRLLMGMLAGRGGNTKLTGDVSLCRRPMKRVAEPLGLMGAKIQMTDGNFAPLSVNGTPLRAIQYALKIPSSQVKSALLLGALSAEGTTLLTGAIGSRDHTERLLPQFDVSLAIEESLIRIKGQQKLKAACIRVPGDLSSAAYWIAAATLIPGATLELKGVSLNPTRAGFLRVLDRMGAHITTEVTSQDPEPVGSIRVSSAPLRAVQVTREEIPHLIDELSLLAVVATQSVGKMEVEGAEELLWKESNRLEALSTNLQAMGVHIEKRNDGFCIDGPQALKGTLVQSFSDHRIAMSFSIAALVAEGRTIVDGSECVNVSYPGFYPTLFDMVKL